MLVQQEGVPLEEIWQWNGRTHGGSRGGERGRCVIANVCARVEGGSQESRVVGEKRSGYKSTADLSAE